jgi:signal peptidase I
MRRVQIRSRVNTENVAPESGPESEGPEPSSSAKAGRRVGSALKEIIIVVVAALVISTLVKSFLFRAYVIPSGSMENTLQVNDRVFVNLLAPKVVSLHRGDVVVFKDEQGWLENQPKPAPAGPAADALTFLGLRADDSTQHLVKRLIGMPGDTVECCSVDGKIKVNGKAISEPYIRSGSRPSDVKFKAVVPKGKIWVMGDHRDDSADSRAHPDKQGGFVDIDAVEGRASLIAWPLGRFGKVDNEPDVFDGVKSRKAKAYNPDAQVFSNAPENQ